MDIQTQLVYVIGNLLGYEIFWIRSYRWVGNSRLVTCRYEGILPFHLRREVTQVARSVSVLPFRLQEAQSHRILPLLRQARLHHSLMTMMYLSANGNNNLSDDIVLFIRMKAHYVSSFAENVPLETCKARSKLWISNILSLRTNDAPRSFQSQPPGDRISANTRHDGS